nr:PREDICTED: ankyrin repeat domain-containing protein 16-like isoform X1 [Megachile rotundata]
MMIATPVGVVVVVVGISVSSRRMRLRLRKAQVGVPCYQGTQRRQGPLPRGHSRGSSSPVTPPSTSHLTARRRTLHGETFSGLPAPIRCIRGIVFEAPFDVGRTSREGTRLLRRGLECCSVWRRAGFCGSTYYAEGESATVDCLKRADWTPLMLACTKTGSHAHECIATLLNAKANPFLRNKDGWTALHMVCRSGDEVAFDLLVNESIKCIDDRSNNGRSSMHIAAFHGHEGIIDRLAALNSNFLNSRDSSGSTPLHEATKAGYLNVVKQIIQLGADVRATDNVDQTILHVAALTGNTEIVRYILDNNFIDIHAEALFNVTPLVAARRSNQLETIECLMQYGAVK